VRFFERADLAFLTAVRLLDAEQFGFHPFRAHRRRVDDDERAFGAARQGVQRAGRKLLAGAGWADDQDPAVGGRHLLDGLAQLVDRGRAANQRRGRELLERPHLPLEAEFSSARSATSTSRSALNGFSMKS